MNEEFLKVPKDFLLEIWRLNTAKKKQVVNDSNAVFIYLGEKKKRKMVMETAFFFKLQNTTAKVKTTIN